MSSVAERLSGAAVDLSPRIKESSVVVGSPATSAEVVVASVTVPAGPAVHGGILVMGFVAFTMGTDGTSFNLKLRQTGTSGTTLKATGLIPLATTVLGTASIIGFDSAPVMPGQVYVVTLLCTAASATSTVSATQIVAIVL